MNDLIMQYIEEFYQVETVEQYDKLVHQLNRDLYNQNFDRNIVQVVEKNQRYYKLQ